MSWLTALADDPHTIGRWLTDRAAQSSRRIAIDDRGVTTDYATLAARASALAEGLRAAGYGPGHRIATVTGNSTDHVIAFFACALSGVALVPLSWRLTPRELTDLLRRSEPALVLVEDDYATLAAEALRELAEAAARRRPRNHRGRGIRPTRPRIRSQRDMCATMTRCSSSTPPGARRRRKASC